MKRPRHSARPALLAIVILTALVVALTAVIVVNAVGVGISATLCTAGAAFVATLTLGLSVCQFLDA